MKLILISLLGCVAAASWQNEDSGCRKLMKTYHPRGVCKFPLTLIPPEQGEECEKKCKESQTEETVCCKARCDFRLNHVYENGVFKIDNVMTFFDFELKNDTIGSDWQPVIQKSINTCRSMVTSSSTEICSIPTYIFVILDCLMQENFINCPKSHQINPAKWADMVKFVEAPGDCGIKVEDRVLVMPEFWNQGAYETIDEGESTPMPITDESTANVVEETTPGAVEETAIVPTGEGDAETEAKPDPQEQ